MKFASKDDILKITGKCILVKLGPWKNCQQRGNRLEIAGKCILVKLGPWKNCWQRGNRLEIAGKCLFVKFGMCENCWQRENYWSMLISQIGTGKFAGKGEID